MRRKLSGEAVQRLLKSQIDDKLGINTPDDERHRVRCPHCGVGASIVHLKRKHGSVELPAGEKHPCNTCGRYFEIAVRISLYGKLIADE